MIKVWPTKSLSGYNVKTDKGEFYINNADVLTTRTFPKSAKYPYKVEWIQKKSDDNSVWSKLKRTFILTDKCPDMSRQELSEITKQICDIKMANSSHTVS